MTTKHPFKHPTFISALLLLIVNDAFLKYAYPGLLTGKLSDFAGLYVFSIFWAHYFPAARRLVFFLTGILFCIWKSSLSQPFINACNGLGIPITRVVDYTDLWALAILPVAYLTLATVTATARRSWLVNIIAAI